MWPASVSALSRDQLIHASFPHEAQTLELRETHLSYVLLTGQFAYKVKKALKLDFVDASTLERRRRLCEEELRLNRRYAPDLYLSVVPITADRGTLRFGGEGPPIEYAVQMRQFDPKLELPALLRDNAVDIVQLTDLADRIAAFHAAALPLRDAGDRGMRWFLDKAQENLASLLARAKHLGEEVRMAKIEAWTRRTLSEKAEQLRERERRGSIRECHGDLHCGNVVRWEGRLIPFDCIEFDPELRFIDVLNDVAFLVMDLMTRGRADLAFGFLSRYLERTGDYSGVPLLPTYLVYRALVRAKVELTAFEQHPEASDILERAHAYIDTAASIIQPTNPATLVIMHGASGSGKSWLSAQLVPALRALRVRSDLERKRLAGIDPFDPDARPSQDIYTLDFNERTYDYMRECARACLQSGISTIVDAAFLRTHERRAFAELAREHGASFLIVSCQAEEATLVSRIAARRAARNDPSDADEAVMRQQLRTMEPFVEDELPHVLQVGTHAPDALRTVRSRVLEP